jgi:hypothetical protein
MPCWYCGVRLSKKNGPTLRTRDHVVPKSKGGWKTVLACLLCNSKKADKSLEEFRNICGGPEFWGEKIARLEYQKTAFLEDESKSSEHLPFLWNNPQLIGKRFGRMTIIGHVAGSGESSSRWLARCDCGNEEVRKARAAINKLNDIDACVECRKPLGKYRSDYFHATGVELDPKYVFYEFYPDHENNPVAR